MDVSGIYFLVGAKLVSYAISTANKQVGRIFANQIVPSNLLNEDDSDWRK
jgi:hypothetical protein